MKTAFQDAVPMGFISLYRGLERRLSPAAFYSFLRPLFLVRGVLNNAFKKTTTPPAMPDFLRTPRNIRTRIQDRADLYLNGIVANFPDRLAAPKWLARCEIEGLEHLQEARRNGRLVALGYCHFGSFPIMHCWLRAMGLPVGGLVGGNSTMRTPLARLQDRFLPLPEVPVAMYLDQLRELARFFAAGNILYMAVDAPTGKQMTVPFCDGWDFQMATGAIRFASRYEADLIPCSITDEGSWRYRITLGRPVPRGTAGRRSRLAARGQASVG